MGRGEGFTCACICDCFSEIGLTLHEAPETIYLLNIMNLEAADIISVLLPACCTSASMHAAHAVLTGSPCRWATAACLGQRCSGRWVSQKMSMSSHGVWGLRGGRNCPNYCCTPLHAEWGTFAEMVSSLLGSTTHRSFMLPDEQSAGELPCCVQAHNDIVRHRQYPGSVWRQCANQSLISFHKCIMLIMLSSSQCAGFTPSWMMRNDLGCDGSVT